MKKSEIRNLKVGDKIKIRPLHYRVGYRTAVRKIVAIDSIGIQVRMFGWSNFYLRKNEILGKIGPDEK